MTGLRSSSIRRASSSRRPRDHWDSKASAVRSWRARIETCLPVGAASGFVFRVAGATPKGLRGGGNARPAKSPSRFELLSGRSNRTAAI